MRLLSMVRDDVLLDVTKRGEMIIFLSHLIRFRVVRKRMYNEYGLSVGIILVQIES